jgi:hypothetical protein
MGGQPHAPAASTLGKDPAPIVQETGWVPGPIWTGGKSRLHRDSIPDRPAHSQSLYRLSYRALFTVYTLFYFNEPFLWLIYWITERASSKHVNLGHKKAFHGRCSGLPTLPPLVFPFGTHILRTGWDSSVGIATRYGLDGSGIESRWKWDLPHLSTPALRPTHNGYRVFLGGKAVGAWRWSPIPI